MNYYVALHTWINQKNKQKQFAILFPSNCKYLKKMPMGMYRALKTSHLNIQKFKL